VKKLILSLLCLMLLAFSADADDQQPLLIKGVNKEEYVRLFFYCDQPVKFTTTLQSGILKVNFDKRFTPDDESFKNLKNDLKNQIDSATLSFDGKTAIFKLKSQDYGFRRFIGDKFVGIDLLRKSSSTSAMEKKLAENIPLPKVHAAPTPKEKPVSNAKLEKLTRKFEEAGVTGTEVIDSTQSAAPVAAEAPAPPAEAEKADAAPTNEAAPALSSPQVDLPEPKISDITTPGKPDGAVANLSLKTKIIFPWTEDVAASVFVRGNYLWVVFDKFKQFDTAKLLNDNKPLFSDVKQIINKSYTILNFKLTAPINITAFKENNNWVIGQTDNEVLPSLEPAISLTNNDLSGSKVVLSSNEELSTLRLIDPAIGDEMVILPFSEDKKGLQLQRKYPDFVFIKTIQGAVIELISDNVNLDIISGGIEVSGPTNKLASSAQSYLRELQEKEKEASLRAEKLKHGGGDLSLIKFNTWMLGGNKTYQKDLEGLLQNITDADWSKKNEPRLSLARFYFAHKLYPEALSVINAIREADKTYANSNDVKIIEASTLYLLGQYTEAINLYDAIDSAKLEDKEKQEIKFWRIAANIQLGNQIKLDKFITESTDDKKKDDEDNIGNDKADNTRIMWDTSSKLLKMIRKMDPDFVNSEEIQKLESTARFVTSHYQEEIKRFEESDLYKQDSNTFATEDDKSWWSTSEQRKSDKADLPFIENVDNFLKYYPPFIYNDFALLDLENRLKKNDLIASEDLLNSFKEEERTQEKNSIEFLRGLFYAKDEEDAKAIDTWKPLTEDVDDRYNRTRAQFALTTFQLRKKQITEKDAIDRLNTIRSSWRGGIIEFQILKMLGEFYMDEKQYMEGFKVWRSAISAFPGSDEALIIAKKMSDKFVQVFSAGNSENVPKLEALTLYYEFRELTPIGKLGDDMISNLADRLIEVDLLDRAAALLTHQVRFRLVGDEKDIATLKLVKVHLMNHHEQDAVDVLKATERDNISPEIATERKYLEAKALLALGQSNKVLALLKDDDSHQASYLKADVYWKNKVWKKVVDSLETPFRDLRREEKNLTDEEMDQLLRLAVAYALTDNKGKLQVLYEDFIDFLPNPEKKKVFIFVATDKGPVDSKNLEYTVELNDMRNFLNKYMTPGETTPASSLPVASN
jgi:hypothetical protein